MTDNTPRQRQTAQAKASVDGAVSHDPANTPQQQEQQPTATPQPPWYANFSGIARMIMIWFAVQYGLGMLGKLVSQRTPADNTAVQPDVPGAGAPAASDAAMPIDTSHLPAASVPLWAKDTSMDLYFYLSENPNATALDNYKTLLWHVPGLTYGDWNDERQSSFEIDASQHVQNNGSLYAHILLAESEASIDPADANYQETMISKTTIELTRFLKKRKQHKEKKLLAGRDEIAEESEPETDEKNTVVSYWYPNITLGIVSDFSEVAMKGLPPQITRFINLEPTGLRNSKKQGFHYPILFHNDFWTLKEHILQRPINDTVNTLPLNIKIHPISFLKFTMYAQFDFGLKQQAQQMGGGGSEMDEFKRVLIDTNPYLLGLTAFVSLLHTVFEFLAFKNDISHWRNKDEMTGVSLRSIITNIVFQVIILLYLLDQSEDTSWMILIGQFVGVAIEAWKITKVVNVKLEPAQGLIPYRIRFTDKHVLSDTEEKTREYDQIAYRYLSWVTYPLLLAYAIWSVVYQQHKGWYSFIVTTLVGFVYTWGFIAMTPQLYINYRLKSVSHMPGRTMVYKTLGTFIDDLFAWVVKMPILHRLATLRDDVIFFVYLYQRWIYRVDSSRANEFGQVDTDALKKEREAVEKKEQ